MGMQTSGRDGEMNVTASQRQSNLILDNLQLLANIITLYRSRFKAQALLKLFMFVQLTAD